MSLENASLLAKFGFISIALGLILLIYGFTSILAKQKIRHKWFMFSAVMVDAIFLVLYISRYVTEGNVPFTGPKNIFKFIYLPVLTIHILTAIISIWFVLRQVKSGYLGQQYSTEGKLSLQQPYRESHIKYGKIAVYVWGSSFIGGIIVFILLYIA